MIRRGLAALPRDHHRLRRLLPLLIHRPPLRLLHRVHLDEGHHCWVGMRNIGFGLLLLFGWREGGRSKNARYYGRWAVADGMWLGRAAGLAYFLVAVWLPFGIDVQTVQAAYLVRDTARIWPGPNPARHGWLRAWAGTAR